MRPVALVLVVGAALIGLTGCGYALMAASIAQSAATEQQQREALARQESASRAAPESAAGGADQDVDGEVGCPSPEALTEADRRMEAATAALRGAMSREDIVARNVAYHDEIRRNNRLKQADDICKQEAQEEEAARAAAAEAAKTSVAR